MINILVSSAGRRVGLINCWRQAASDLKIDLTVLAADAAPELSAACHLADRCFTLPRCDSPGYVEAMLDICRNQGIAVAAQDLDLALDERWR